MSPEEEPFRVLSPRELRALRADEQADYLGALVARKALQADAQAASTPGFDERKANRRATLAGSACLAAAWAAVYVAGIYMRRGLDDDLVTGITLISSLVLTPLLFFVRGLYLRRARKRAGLSNL